MTNRTGYMFIYYLNVQYIVLNVKLGPFLTLDSKSLTVSDDEMQVHLP